MRALVFVFSLLVSHSSVSNTLAPDFHLPELAGERSHALSDYRGTVIYLDFWASWCGPCRQSLPALELLQKQYDPSEFRVIAINVDENADEALSFLREYPVTYTVLVERTGRTQREYNLVGLPSSFLIDQKGEVIGSFQGFHPDHINQLKKAIAHLLEE